jgi:hypothetical protein
MDPAEAVAHLVAHDVRAPVFLAAELLRMTVDDGRDDEALAPIIGRLEAVVDGLRAAGGTCDDVVESLRPKPQDDAADPLSDVLAAVWPSVEVTVRGDGDVPPLVKTVLRDLATVVPFPTSVGVDLGEPVRCQVRAGGIEDTSHACLALVRAARRVRALELRGGDFRVGRDDNEFVIDVRFPQGADGP